MFLVHLYIAISCLLFVVADLILRIRVRMGLEDEKRYKEKLAITDAPRAQGELIWLHASGVGETNAILPFIRAYHEEFPNYNFLVTGMTVNAFKIFASANLPQATHQYAPVDSWFIIKKFLAYWKPCATIVMESEIWPNYIMQASRAGPIFLINARMSDMSFRRWSFFKSTLQYLLSFYRLILPGTRDDQKKFQFFKATGVNYIGHLKKAAPKLQCKLDVLERLQSSISSRKILLYVSTHRGEEAFALAAHKALKESHPDLLTIIAPRHLYRAEEVRDIAADLGLSSSFFTENHGDISNQDDVCIVNAVGELGSFYRVSKIAFIGGSLVAAGGHNLIEAGKFGLAVVTGTHTFNFRDMVQEMTDEEAVIVVQNGEELEATLQKLLDNEEYLEQQQARTLAFADKQPDIIREMVLHCACPKS